MQPSDQAIKWLGIQATNKPSNQEVLKLVFEIKLIKTVYV